jgi:hypothetical protein
MAVANLGGAEVTELQIYYNRPAALEASKYTEFSENYNTSSKQPNYYEDNPDTENNVSLDWHFFKVHMDAAGIQYMYCPVRQVKRCIRWRHFFPPPYSVKQKGTQ